MEILVVVISWLIFGGASSYFASQRGRDPFAWFLIGMLLGILGLLLLFLLPPVEAAKEEKEEIQEGEGENPPIAASESASSYLIKEWFFLDDKRQQTGPYSFSNLKRNWDLGKLTAATLVWSEGMEAWKPIDELPKLKEALQ